MADISNVDTSTIKDLYERLESLSCKTSKSPIFLPCANIIFSPNYDSDPLLAVPGNSNPFRRVALRHFALLCLDIIWRSMKWRIPKNGDEIKKESMHSSSSSLNGSSSFCAGVQ